MPRTLVATVPGMITEQDLEPLRKLGEVRYEERANISPDELADLCAGFDVLMLNYDIIKKLPPEFFAKANVKKLKSIAADITGMDWASPQAAQAQGVRLQNIPHYSTESVAESILCEILLHSRQRHLAYKDELAGKEPEARKGINLQGRVAGIVGLGSIGVRVAELLQACGMRTQGWNRSSKKIPRVDSVSLPRLFETSEIICIAAKTVTEGEKPNAGMIDASLLELCRNAIVVNLASYKLVDTNAMAAAIQSGHVSAYTVERSAPMLESPLAAFPQVHFPPSNAWNSDESLTSLRDTWIANAISALKGKPQNIYLEK